MPAIRIPTDNLRRWSGAYEGDYAGSLRRTYNVDLHENPGKVKLAKKYKKVFTNDTAYAASDTAFKRVEAFVRAQIATDTNYRIFAAVRNTATDTTDTATTFALFKSGALGASDTGFDTGWDVDTSLNQGSASLALQDLISFPDKNSTNADRIFSSANRQSDLIYLDSFVGGGSNTRWIQHSASIGILDTTVPFRPMDVFEGELIIGNRNKVTTLNEDSVIVRQRLVGPHHIVIHHVFHTPSRVWLLSSASGKRGQVSEWDGFSRFFVSYHELHAVPLTGVDYFGSAILAMSDGTFHQFNGSQFVPLRDANGQVLALPLSQQENESLLLTNDFPPDPSQFGIPRRGMVLDGDKILINVGPTRLKTDPYKHVSGLWVLDPRRGLLYCQQSYGDGSATDFGHSDIKFPGAIYRDPEGGVKLISARIKTDAVSDSEEAAMFTYRRLDDTSDTHFQRGFIQTQQVHLPEPNAAWETVWVKHRQFDDTAYKLLMKARAGEHIRVSDSSATQAILKATWVTDSSFTVKQADSGDSFIVGDEVEVVSGPNAGSTAHITSISGSHGDTQTISMDENMTSESSGSGVRIDRWVKLQTPDGDCSILGGDSEVYHRFVIPQSARRSPDISFKVEMRGKRDDMEFEELIAYYEVDQQSKA